MPTSPTQLLELREENARLRERLRGYQSLPESRKTSATGDAQPPLQQQQSAPPGGGGTPSGVPSQLSM